MAAQIRENNKLLTNKGKMKEIEAAVTKKMIQRKDLLALEEKIYRNPTQEAKLELNQYGLCECIGQINDNYLLLSTPEHEWRKTYIFKLCSKSKDFDVYWRDSLKS